MSISTHTLPPCSDTWQTYPPPLRDDQTLLTAIVALHQALYRDHFAADPLLNHHLPIEPRAFRRVAEWRLVLVLTPWMLTRLLVPDQPLALPLPADSMLAPQPRGTYRLLGPLIAFDLLGAKQKAHLAYAPSLGHYLQQPLVLNMAGYPDGDAVFAAWDQVIRTRDENMAKFQRDCPWQREISRRELFTGRRREGG